MERSGWETFTSWFESVTGFSPGWITVVLAVWAVAARTVAAFRHDRDEVARRRSLIDNVRTFIGRALDANRRHLAELERLRIRAHGLASLAALPIDALQDLPGVGPQTVRSLAAIGCRTYLDLLERDPELGFRIGVSRGSTIRAEVARRVSVIDRAVSAWVPGRPMPFKRVPSVDEAFDAHVRAVVGRNAALDADLVALVKFDEDVAAFAAATSQRTAEDRWTSITGGWLHALMAPGRLAARAGLLFGSLYLLSILPVVGLAWDDGLGPALDAVGVASAWFAFHGWLLVHFTLGDMPRAWHLQPPAPENFAQQRLQFRVLQMARATGIAPPRVAIDSSLEINACAVGRPSGPSLVVATGLLVDGLSEPELDAVLGHELGHLRGDDSRRRWTLRTMLSPLTRCRNATLSALANVHFRVGNRVFKHQGRLFLHKRWGLASLFYALLWMPLAVVGLTLTGLVMTFRCIGGLSARVDELEADRMGANLSGAPEHMARALDAVDSLQRRLMGMEAEFSTRRMPGAPLGQVQPPLGLRVIAWVDDVERRLGVEHPRTPVRIAALKSEVPLLAELAGATLRLSLILGVTCGALWFTLVGTAAATSRAVELGRRVVAGFDPEPLAAPASAPPATPGATERRIGQRRGCHLRRRPDQASESVVLLPAGARCTVGAKERGGWLAATCSGQAGFIHESCLAPP